MDAGSSSAPERPALRRLRVPLPPARELPPPLPLLPAKPVTARAVEARNALGHKVRSIQHRGECPATPEPIADVSQCWALQDFFEQAELLPCECPSTDVREVAYDCSDQLLADESESDDSEPVPHVSPSKRKETPSSTRLGRDPTCQADTLLFDSMFESGNLRRAVRVTERQRCPHWRRLQAAAVPHLREPHQEYELWAREDIHTKGNIQWFYFAVRNTRARQRVRFTIVNNNKSDSLFNYGMKPLVYSEHRAAYDNLSWTREGEDICYYQSAEEQPSRKRRKKMFYKFTWTYTFQQSNDVVYFAYTFPYTYTDLQRYINTIEASPRCHSFFRRKTLCTTLADNTVDVITITATTSDPADLRRRKAVVISARVHPGETNASLMMHGVLKFLTSSSPQAQLLRSKLVFKIVPMLNPDGVVSGNYRCSLAGVDLNRRWAKPSRKLHAPIFAMKSMIKRLSQQRQVALFCDLHGHSRKYNIFVYGCAPRRGTPKERGRPRIFPHLLYRQSPSKPQEDYDYTHIQEVLDNLALPDAAPADAGGAGAGAGGGTGSPAPSRSGSSAVGRGNGCSNSALARRNQSAAPSLWRRGGHGSASDSRSGRGGDRLDLGMPKSGPVPMMELEASMGHESSTGRFSFVDCRFNVHPSKRGTGRVVCWRELHVANAFTMEASFCGTGDCSIIDKRCKYVKKRRRWLRKNCSNLELMVPPTLMAAPAGRTSPVPSGDSPSSRGVRVNAGPLSLTATPILRASPAPRSLPGSGRPPRPTRRAMPARGADAAKSVAELVADAVDAVDAQDAGRRPSLGAASGASGASGAESSSSPGSVRRLSSGDGVGGAAPGALADVEDAYSSESEADRDEVDDDDEDEEDEEEGKGGGDEEEDDEEEDDGTKQGDDDDTLQDFVQRGRGGGGGDDGGGAGDGTSKAPESDTGDGSGSDGEPEGEGEDEVDRPRVPTHFTARDLMSQGRALCHVLVRLCNLHADPSPKHKTVRLRRTVVPGGPSGLADEQAGRRTPPVSAARSRLLLAAGGDLVASPLVGKAGDRLGRDSPVNMSDMRPGAVITGIIDGGDDEEKGGGNDPGDVELELELEGSVADSAAEEDLLMEVMAEVDVSEDEEETEGSESDPSGDNLDVEDLKRTSTFKKLVGRTASSKSTKAKKRKARRKGKGKGKGRKGKGSAASRAWRLNAKRKVDKTLRRKASTDDASDGSATEGSASTRGPRTERARGRRHKNQYRRDATPIQMRRGASVTDINKDTMWKLSRPLPWASPYEVHDKVYASTSSVKESGSRRQLPGFASDSSAPSRSRSRVLSKRPALVRSSSSGSLSQLASDTVGSTSSPRSGSRLAGRSRDAAQLQARTGGVAGHGGHGGATGSNGGGGGGGGGGGTTGTADGTSGSPVPSSGHRRRHHSEHRHRHRQTAGGGGASVGGGSTGSRQERGKRGERRSGHGSRRSGGQGSHSSLPNVPAVQSGAPVPRHALVPRMFTASFDGEARVGPKHGFYVMRKKPQAARPGTTAASPVRFPSGPTTLMDKDYAPPSYPSAGSRRVRSAASAEAAGRGGMGDDLGFGAGARANFRGEPPLGGFPSTGSPDFTPPVSPRGMMADPDHTHRVAALHGGGMGGRQGSYTNVVRSAASRQFAFADTPGAAPRSPGAGGPGGDRGGGGSQRWSTADMEVAEYVMRHKLAAEFGAGGPGAAPRSR